MSKRSVSNDLMAGHRRGSRPFSLRRGARLLIAASTALLSVGVIGLVGTEGAGAATVGVATGAPAAGSVLVADYYQNAVFSFLPGASSELTVGSVGNGVLQPTGVAVDSIGDTFISNEGTGAVDEFNYLGQETTLGATFCYGCDFQPNGIAVDGAGDLFVADTGDGEVFEVPNNTTNVNVLENSFTPYGIASDTSGDVFIADQTDNEIVEINTAGVESVVATLSETPYGVAVDSSGDLFVTLPTAQTVVEIPVGTLTPNGQTTPVRTVATAVSAVSIAVDQSGNAYFPDSNTGTVWEATASGSSFNTPVAIQSGFEDADAIAVYPPAAYSPSIIAKVTGTQVYGGPITYTTTITPAADAAEVTGTASCTNNWILEGVSTPAGTTPFTSCSGLSGPAGMQLIYEPSTDTVTPAPLTISPATTSMSYGTLPLVLPEFSGFVWPDSSTALATQPVCSTTATVAAAVGTQFPTTCTGGTDPNYTITDKSGTLTVAAAVLNVVAPSESITYGSAVGSLLSNITGFVNGQTALLLGLTTSCSSTAPATPNVGTYTTTCTGVASIGNYTLNYVQGAVTVNPATLTISASSPSVIYGAAVPTITATTATFVNGDSFTKTGFTAPTCSTTYTATSAAGTSPTTSCTGAVAPNYSIKYVNGAVTIGTATLSISASSPSMTYGGTVPAVTASYSGFANGQSSTSLSTQPTCTSTASTSPTAGSYVTSCTGAVDSNYTIKYVAGSMTVAPAPLTITASNGTMNFGGTAPAITAGYSGFVNGDTSTSLTTQPTCTTTATSSSQVGSYASSCSGAKDANYTISYVAGSVKVMGGTLTITASSPSVVYGTTATITPTYTGQSDGTPPASMTTAPTCTTVESKSSGVGTYTSNCSGAVDPEYTIVYVPGTVTVSQAALRVTASSANIASGASIPAVTASYTGFVGADTSASLTTQPTCSTTATSSSPTGTYPTTCSGAVDANYSITYVAGTLHIGLVILTVDAPTVNKLYGAAIPTLTASITGFPAGVTLANSGITGTATCSTVATSSSPAGSYPVTCVAGTLTSRAYSFAFAPGLLTVTFSQACITGWYFGTITVGSGQATCIGPNAIVLGAINVKQGGALDIESSTVLGSIASYKATAFRVCSSSLTAAMSVTYSTGLVTMGDANSNCGGNTLIGSIAITGNTGGVEFSGNTVWGAEYISGNSGTLPSPETGSTYVANNRIL